MRCIEVLLAVKGVIMAGLKEHVQRFLIVEIEMVVLVTLVVLLEGGVFADGAQILSILNELTLSSFKSTTTMLMGCRRTRGKIVRMRDLAST